MNNKILKDLIKKLISECNDQIKDIKEDIKEENNNNINKLKVNIDILKNFSNEEIKDILNKLSYKEYKDRLSIERHIMDLKQTLISNNKISDVQYNYINDLYNRIDDYLENNSDENKKMISDLNDMISLYNSLLNKLSMINSEFIDEIDVLDLVLKNSDFSYYIKKDILRGIMNYNRELYLKNI